MATIFRHKKNKQFYTIQLSFIAGYYGDIFCTPLYFIGKKLKYKFSQLYKHFDKVAEI